MHGSDRETSRTGCANVKGGKLADELIRTELDASGDARWHAHLLRLKGDALVWGLLSRHVIRELARDGRKPASFGRAASGFRVCAGCR